MNKKEGNSPLRPERARAEAFIAKEGISEDAKAVLAQIIHSSYIHAWVDAEGKPAKNYHEGVAISLGRDASGEVAIITLPKTPSEFITMLERHMAGARITSPIRKESSAQIVPISSRPNTATSRGDKTRVEKRGLSEDIGRAESHVGSGSRGPDRNEPAQPENRLEPSRRPRGEVNALGMMQPHPKARGTTISLTGEWIDRDKPLPTPDFSRQVRNSGMETVHECDKLRHQFSFVTVDMNELWGKGKGMWAEMTARLRQALVHLGKKYHNESVRNLHHVFVHHFSDRLRWETDREKLLHFYIPAGTSLNDITASIEKKMIEENVIIDDAGHARP